MGLANPVSSIRTLSRALLALSLYASLGSAGAVYAESPSAPAATPTTVDLAAEAMAPAANDLAIARLYIEASEADPAALAKRVNTALAEALVIARGQPSVTTRSGGISSFPVYKRDNRQIESWRMRAELVLESRDLPAVSTLVGQLQQTLAVGQLTLSPAPETRRAARDKATQDAIAAFRERATQVAGTLGQRYRIAHLEIEPGSGPLRPPPVARMAALSSDAMPAMPVEAGESQVAVVVRGRIELLP